MRRARLPIFLETRSSRTLQEQIYGAIRHAIVEGQVGADCRLPSTRSLAAELGVSRTTTLLVLEQLRAEGYVIARRGSGMFIAPELPVRAPEQELPSGGRVARPPFSWRGNLLARTPAPDRRRAGAAACAFRLGTPALDQFPLKIWSRLARECARSSVPRLLDYSPLAGLRELRE